MSIHAMKQALEALEGDTRYRAACAYLDLRTAIEEAENAESPRDVVCEESDGCPTELAVLQRFWREAERAESVMEIGVDESSKCRELPMGTKLYTHPAPVPEGMVLDAERYRWLRDKRSVTIDTMLHGNGCRARSVDELDAAIDAAMKEGK